MKFFTFLGILELEGDITMGDREPYIGCEFENNYKGSVRADYEKVYENPSDKYNSAYTVTPTGKWHTALFLLSHPDTTRIYTHSTLMEALQFLEKVEFLVDLEILAAGSEG